MKEAVASVTLLIGGHEFKIDPTGKTQVQIRDEMQSIVDTYGGPATVTIVAALVKPATRKSSVKNGHARRAKRVRKGGK